MRRIESLFVVGCLGAGLLVGCTSDVLEVAPLAAPSEAKSLVLAYIDDDIRAAGVVSQVQVYRVGEAPIEYRFDRWTDTSNAQVAALFFRRTLEDLAMAEGTVNYASSGAVRKLPNFDYASTVDLSPSSRAAGGSTQERGASWAPVTTVDDALSGFVFRDVDRVLFCADAGGCLATQSADAECIAPCAGYETPTAPSPPIAPSFMPCPAGWSSTDEGLCDPWSGATTAQGACSGPGLALFPGESACVSIGRLCPVGSSPWRGDLPTGQPITYVLRGASDSSAGTAEDPVGSLGRALDLAEPGGVIALSAGDFTENVRVQKTVEIRGLCAEKTTITSQASTDALTIDNVAVTLADLSVSGPGNALAVLGPMSFLRAEGVHLGPISGGGLRIVNGRADLSEVRISHSDASAVDVKLGVLQARRLFIDETIGGGLRVRSSSVAVEDVLFDRVGGAVLWASDSSVFKGDRVVALDSGDWLVEDTSFSLSQSRLEPTLTGPSHLTIGFLGQHLPAILSRVLLRGTNVLLGAFAETTIIDVSIVGGTVRSGGRLKVERLKALEAVDAGCALQLVDDADADIEDLVLNLDTKNVDRLYSVCKDPSTVLSGRRWLIDVGSLSHTGLRLEGQTTLTDVDLVGPESGGEASLASGVTVLGRVALERMRLRRVPALNFEIIETGDLDLRDVDIVGGTSGVHVRNGGKARIDRFFISEVLGPGLEIDDMKRVEFGAATLDATSGHVQQCDVGAQLAQPDQAFRVLSRVSYTNNAVNFEYR